MLLIENKKGLKVYTIKNKYLCECGVLNEKNVCNVLVKYKERKLKKWYCLSHDHIAYYSGVGGIEIHGAEGDYIYCTSSAWYPPKKYHRVKIHYNDNGSDYIVVRGYKVPLNECIRFGTMRG